MAVFKCKNCGDTVEFENGASVSVCKNCGATQTLSRLDNGKTETDNLLRRGQLLLEARDWASAEECFNKVLSADAGNAEAYIGLMLAEEKLVSIDSFADYYLKRYQDREVKTLAVCSPDTDRKYSVIRELTVPGYLPAERIGSLFEFDLEYNSSEDSAAANLEKVRQALANDRSLDRVKRSGGDEGRKIVEDIEKRIIAAYEERLERSRGDAQKAKEERTAAYGKHLDQAEAKAREMNADALRQREADYQKACLQQDNADTIPAYFAVASAFGTNGLKYYKDSIQREAACRKVIQELQEAEAERQRQEAERQRLLKAQEEKNRKAKKKRIVISIAAVALVSLIASILIPQVIVPALKYKAAVAMLAEEKYEEAIAAFEELGDYWDSAGQIEIAKDLIIERENAAAYADAEALLKNGYYIAAAEAFEALGDYSDAEERMLEASYLDAEAMLKAGEYAKAAAAFAALGDYKDSPQKPAEIYSAIESSVGSDNTVTAAMAFGSISDYYEQARVRSMELWDQIAVRDTVAAGTNHTVGLKANGTVVAVGDNSEGQCDVGDWQDIVAVAAGPLHTVGLKANGTVVAVGDNSYGRCDVGDWKNVVAIAAGSDYTVGLKADGTVVGVGNYVLGQCKVSGWKDIVAIAARYGHTVGLKADGTVFAVGDNSYGQCKVGGGNGIAAISVGYRYTVGLKADGTVVAVGDNSSGWGEVIGLKDIVAISAGYEHIVGLKADGTVVAVGDNKDGQCDVSDWKDIVAISAGREHTVGLKADGTVIAVGNNKNGQCNVIDWKDIKLPNK